MSYLYLMHTNPRNRPPQSKAKNSWRLWFLKPAPPITIQTEVPCLTPWPEIEHDVPFPLGAYDSGMACLKPGVSTTFVLKQALGSSGRLGKRVGAAGIMPAITRS